MSEQIRMTVEAKPGAAVEITSLACGPAEEVFDALQQLGGCGRLHVTLVDFDYEALAFVAAKREALQLQRAISLVDANLIHVALGRTALPVEDQDLVYTIGAHRLLQRRSGRQTLERRSRNVAARRSRHRRELPSSKPIQGVHGSRARVGADASNGARSRSSAVSLTLRPAVGSHPLRTAADQHVCRMRQGVKGKSRKGSVS